MQIFDDTICRISENRVIICLGGKYGVVDTEGISIIPCIYDKIRPIPFIKQYSYDYGEELKQCEEKIELIVAKCKGKDEYNYTETGFNINGEMIIRPCLSINLGEYFSLIETYNEFPYVCTELYRNLILELFPRRYFFLNLKTIGFDYSKYIEELEECAEYVCGKIIEDD